MGNDLSVETLYDIVAKLRKENTMLQVLITRYKDAFYDCKLIIGDEYEI